MNKVKAAIQKFWETERPQSVLYCNNGIFRLELKRLTNPVYFTYEIQGYNPELRKFEFVHNYGSQFISDVYYNSIREIIPS